MKCPTDKQQTTAMVVIPPLKVPPRNSTPIGSARTTVRVAPINPAVPKLWWNVSSRIEPDRHAFTSPREDPLLTAKTARKKKAIRFAEDGEISKKRLESGNRIVRVATPRWRSPTTEMKTKPPLTKAQSMKSLMSMNPHCGGRLEPKRSVRFDYETLKRSGHVCLKGYLTVTCPREFRRFDVARKFSVLVEGSLRVIECLFDFHQHRLILTRRGDHEKDVRRRNWWLGHIKEINDSESIRNHLSISGVGSDLIDLDRLPFCGLYMKTESVPLLLVSGEEDILEDLVVLTQHIITYFKSRVEAHLADIERHGSEAPLELFKDFTLEEIVLAELRKDVPSKEVAQLKIWRGGVGPCLGIYGHYVHQGLYLTLDMDRAALQFVFSSGNSGFERTPHPGLDVQSDPRALESAIDVLKQSLKDGVVECPETFCVSDHNSGMGWSADQLSSFVEGNAVVLSSPQWSLPMIIVLPSEKKVLQLKQLVNVLNRTHAVVSKACCECFFSPESDIDFSDDDSGSDAGSACS